MQTQRTGSIVVTAVLLTAVLGLSGVMVGRQLGRDLARQLRAASDGRELEPLVEAAIEEAHYQLVIGAERDPVAFLRDATRTASFHVALAAGAAPEGTTVEPVEMVVVSREKSAGTPPPLFTKIDTTWGVVEMRACARGPGGRPVRRLTVRRLFTVVDHTWAAGQDGHYAHVLPGSIGRVLEGE